MVKTTDRFVNVFRAKIERTTKGAMNSRDYEVKRGDEFKTGVLVVRHDQVFYRGKEAGKLQYKISPHEGRTILEVHDGEEAYLGTHAWRMLVETCEDTTDFVVVNGRTGEQTKGRGGNRR